VEATLIGSALILLLLLLRPFLRRRVGSRMVYVAWLLVALRLLMLLALPNPAMNALKPTLSQDAGIRPMADQVRTRVEDTAHSLYWKTLGADTQRTPLHALVWRVVRATGNGKIAGVLLGFYGAGTLLFLSWMVLANLRFSQAARRGKAGLTQEEQTAYATLCRLRGWRPLPVRRAEGLPGSSLVGWVKPVIVIPADAPEELLMPMLLRETSHHQAHDNWWSLLRCLCCVVHWFNPLVGMAAHAARADAEMACDERVCAPMSDNDRRAYAKMLLAAREISCTTPSVAVCASCITMRETRQTARIRAALHMPRPKAWIKAAFAAGCALVCAAMFATAEMASYQNVPQVEARGIRRAGMTLTTQQQAENYARAFLALEGIGVNSATGQALMFQTNSGWQAEIYPEGSTRPCHVCFNEAGELLFYENTMLNAEKLHPLAEPIGNNTPEGQVWCDFLSQFMERHMPECWQAFEVMNIVRSGRLDGERLIEVQLCSVQEKPLWTVLIQVSPEGRILSFARAEENAE